MAAIEFCSVSKSFHVSSGRQLLRGHLAEWFGESRRQRFFALRDLSFRVEPGESLAVVGSNGAGKTTLLSLISGLCQPDQGSVVVNGHVTGILDLGAGFHYDLTGVENVRVKASLLGLSRRRTEELFDSIVEFSGLGGFVREPLRTYSAGMVLRLAFSVAVHMDPDILLIDEVFMVGDQEFQARCLEKMMSFRRQRRTMLCVSHATASLRRMCERALWLDHGRLVMQGDIDEVLAAYTGPLAHTQVGQA